MNTVDESELPSQAVTVLAIKETCGLVLTLWKVLRFLLTNSRRFLLSAAFSWSNLKRYLLELIGFLEGAYNGELTPFQSTMYATLRCLDEDQPLV